MSGIGRYFVSEWRAIPARLGAKRHFMIALGFLVVAIVAPAQMRTDFLDVRVLLAYALLGAMFAAPVAVESFASEREPGNIPESGNEQWALVLGKAAAGAVWGASYAVLAIAAGLVSANLASRFPRTVVPGALVLVSLVPVACSAAAVGASFSAAISIRAKSVRNASANLRRVFLILLVLAVYFLRSGPADWKSFLARQTTAAGLPFFALVLSVLLLALSGVFLKIGVSKWKDTEIRLHLE